MKKTFLSVALLLALGTGSVFANDHDGINQTVKTSFSNDFRGASHIEWQKENRFDKATFLINDQVLFAYYDPSGVLLAVSRNILSDNLPLNLQASLRKNYSGYWIADLFENAASGETTYYVTIENADEQLVLESRDGTDWSFYKKISKTIR